MDVLSRRKFATGACNSRKNKIGMKRRSSTDIRKNGIFLVGGIEPVL